MAPHDLPPTSTATATKAEQHTLPAERPTSILHRTPWRPPTAVGASGIEITLEGGRTLIDAAGGAAVTCLGHGHPAVVRAIKEQADTLNCTWVHCRGAGAVLRKGRCVQHAAVEPACGGACGRARALGQRRVRRVQLRLWRYAPLPHTLPHTPLTRAQARRQWKPP
jgi:hypothetical protein